MKKFFLFLFLLFSVTFLFSQQNRDSVISDLVQKYVDHFSVEQEFIHLQFNKAHFVKGESIWFKAYVLNRLTRQRFLGTRNLYVELFDPAWKLIQRKIVYMDKGSGWDEFHLGDSLLPGNYVVRAYTSYLRNFGAENYFTQSLTLLGNAAQTDPKKAGNARHDIRVFAEGGSAIEGIETRYGFKYTDPSGYGTAVKGVLKNNNVVVREVTADQNGIGSFAWIPVYGSHTVLEIELPDGTRQETDLPVTHQKGILMNVTAGRDSVQLVLKTNETTRRELQGKDFYIIVHRLGEVTNIFRTSFTNFNNIRFPLERKSLPTGVFHLTLFDQDGKPVADRAVFNHVSGLFKEIDVQLVREQDSVLVTVQTEHASVKETDLSMSFLSPDTETDQFGRSILSRYFLESDIRGFIQDPGFYFNEGEIRAKELDDLLLVQGWSSYDWNAILNKKTVLDYPFEQGFTIEGNIPVTEIRKDEDKVVFLMSPSNTLYLPVLFDSLGRFRFQYLFLQDSTMVYLNATTEKDRKKFKGISFTMNSLGFDPEVSAMQSLKAPEKNSGTNSSWIQAYENLLETVRVSARQKPKSVLSGDRFVSSSDKIYQVDKSSLQRYSTVIDILRREFNVKVSFDDREHVVIDMQAGPISFFYQPQPVLIIDGTINDINMIQGLTVEQVEAIAVNRNGNPALGSRGAGGSIVIKTRNSLEGLVDKVNSSTVVREMLARGYSMPSEYFYPLHLPDPSDTEFSRYASIYWKPSVHTDSIGNASFRFFVPNDIKELKMRVEGVTLDGKLIFIVRRFKF